MEREGGRRLLSDSQKVQHPKKVYDPSRLGVGFPDVGQGRGHWVGPSIRPCPALGGGDLHALWRIKQTAETTWVGDLRDP